jgi:REP element-mobilizing transposase RayT
MKNPKQLVMTFGTWGGWRPGAGRKPSKRRDKKVLHHKRPRLTRRCPAHVTLKVHRDVASLRNKARCKVIRGAFVAACSYPGARIIDWSIQANHLHLIVEADSTQQLSRAMQGFCIRVALGLNRLLGRKGAVFTERYHLRVLATPREIRNARAYVINNFRRHAAPAGRHVDRDWVDPYSSWVWFDGWRDLTPAHTALARETRAGPKTVSDAKGWLLRVGWRRRGLVRVDEVPCAG